MIVMIGVIIAAIQTGTLKGLVDQLITALMNWLMGAFGLDIPWLK